MTLEDLAGHEYDCDCTCQYCDQARIFTIRDALAAKHMSVRALARELGVSATHLSYVLKGWRTSHSLLSDAVDELCMYD
jgi:hypothetical protein